MHITYLDADTREVLDIIDDPAPTINEVKAEKITAVLQAMVVRLIPTDDENEWTVELKIPSAVRQAHTPLPGDRVCFTAKFGYYDEELSGVFLFKRGHSYVIVDDVGGEWQLQSIWQMKKV
jgi:hypothetical protein